MNGVKSKSDGYVRKDFPGGWADDKETALTAEGRSKINLTPEEEKGGIQ